MDNRRQSSGGRGGSVPANNPSFSGGAGANLSALDWAIGLRVRVLTIIDDTYEGTIYSYDPLTSTLTLAQNPTSSAPNSPADYRILKVSFLKDVTVLGNPNKQQRSNTPFTNAEPKIGPVNLNMLGGKEKDTARSEAARVANIGVGVTAEAQEIYDALSRLMPCRWHEKQIIVSENVIIDEPYTLDRVKSSDKNALNRVKKVLDGERKKIETARRSATPVSGERKGG
ncbi:hypothetical protein P167DRAFT_252154 [Morchella conica CCBAS932]|uniref:AD domain-containing protein n=1 Tax=Morchella conica CCBAS932 TaxID=1392247 RepID=A0A3N4KX85_9PEZI|nr:hypothetical protein P167DRAFT_252154 [Morchella conica CCBAS932]